ncbi:MFS transporter [Sphingomonas sp. MG17]|uniref:MFS transporter n=1 Tax=Sphingomonas tagetis TaxID=2949092 RepID=A0A9X2HK15_9SPHN|nr:MFS transporter [Sphingomonas tagetis]MCP3731107.1 MFS transporter [Sphingomonas tagetis]
MASKGIPASGASGAALSETARFKLLLVIAVLATFFNILDRSILSILAEPIKQDLGLTDTQLGFLTGFAFALFYSFAGLPIARYVDRPHSDRPLVIASCMALWSAMTMVCGMAANYGQLLVARMLVAVGESGGGPPILTLMNHYVTPANRSRAFGIYSLGIPLGTLAGLMVGGWLADLVGWRMTFIIVGAPGLLLALIIKLTLHEPRKTEPAPVATEAHPSILENCRVIFGSPALRWLTAATALIGVFVTALPNWTGIYLIRVVELSPTQAGLLLGLTMGAGAIGTYYGGALADRFARAGPGRALLVPCYGLLIGIPAAGLAIASSDWRVFAALYWISFVGAASYLGPFFSVVQQLVGPKYRATTIVIIMMLFNLVGVGLGSFAVGVASDYFAPLYGRDSLRWILVVGHLAAVVPAFLYYRAAALADRGIVDGE